MKVLINTQDQERFGCSVQGAPIHHENVRLIATNDSGEFIVWDMTEDQANLVYNRLKIALGFIHA